jgi:predicted ATPase
MTGVVGLSLVGREREVGLIGDLLDRAGEHGAALVLDGVPGIGKSALLGEAKRAAQDRGGRWHCGGSVGG